MNSELHTLVDDAVGFMLEKELVEEIVTVGNCAASRPGRPSCISAIHSPTSRFCSRGPSKSCAKDKEGNELLLYYLERGDTCTMSFTCCMHHKKSKVHAVAEEDSELVMIPIGYLDGWMSKYQSWKAYIFESIRLRMDEFLETIDSIAFMSMDERLLKYLHDRVRVLGKTEIDTTHQQIADDLHTSRVVVSRLIKQLEHQGKVKLGRNHIEIVLIDN